MKINAYVSSLAIVCGLFFLMGFVTWLNGALIPFLQIVCELNTMQSLLVSFSFYISYTLFAIPASSYISRAGYKTGLVAGLAIMAASAACFIPAALTREYAVFLLALFGLGGGLTLLQTASNPLVVLLGPSETAAVRICLLGILNKLAGALAPIAFVAIAFDRFSGQDAALFASLTSAERDAMLSDLAHELIAPYIGLAATLAMAAFALFLSPLRNVQQPEHETTSISSLRGVMEKPQVLLGALTLFAYLGAEVIAGDTIALFARSVGVADYESLTSYTMFCMVLGYLLGMVLIPKWMSQRTALQLSAVLGVALTCAILLPGSNQTSGTTTALSWLGIHELPQSVLCVALLGLANALVWPAVWPLALQGLESQEIASASALLVMGISGGAVLPLVYGFLADRTAAPQLAYTMLIPCYLMIFYYAVSGHRKLSW
ncbi:MAG: glucose/galactose MFS transporter [Pseudomonadota bacterium]